MLIKLFLNSVIVITALILVSVPLHSNAQQCSECFENSNLPPALKKGAKLHFSSPDEIGGSKVLPDGLDISPSISKLMTEVFILKPLSRSQ